MSKNAWIALVAGLTVLATLAAIGTWIVVTWVDYPMVAARSESAEAAAKRAGLPWVASDLASNEVVPPEDNAASEFQALAGAFTPAGGSSPDWPSSAGEVARVLDRPDVLAIIERMATKPRVVIERDWILGPQTPFTEIGATHTAVLVILARAEARMGADRLGAIDDLGRARRIERLVTDDAPVLMALTTARTARRIAATHARVAERCATDETALRRLAAHFDEPLRDLPAEAFLRADFYGGLASLRNVRGLGGIGALSGAEGAKLRELTPGRVRRDGWPRNSNYRAMAVRYVEEWTRLMLEVRSHAGDPLAQDRAIAAMEARIEGQNGLSYAGVKAVGAPPASLGTSLASRSAQIAVDGALARALLAHRTTGKWPEEPAAIRLPAKDPFGSPYVIKRAGESFRVYSLGPDGRDDGGAAEPVTSARTFDIVAAYPPTR